MKLTDLVWSCLPVLVFLLGVLYDLEDGIKDLMRQVKILCEVGTDQVAVP